MKSYTFRHNDGELTTVRAKDEAAARDAVMRKRYGPPTGIYESPYRGLGLTLVSA